MSRSRKKRRRIPPKRDAAERRGDAGAVDENPNRLDELKRRRDELSMLEENEAQYLAAEVESAFNVSLTELGVKRAKALIREHSLTECLDMIRRLSVESVPEKHERNVIGYLGRCLSIRDAGINRPHLKDTFYIRKILLNRFEPKWHQRAVLVTEIEERLAAGVDRFWLIDCARSCESIWQFLEWIGEG